MRFSVVALLGVVAVAYAQEVAAVEPAVIEVDAEADAEVNVADLYSEPFAFPEGVAKPKPKHLPKKANKPPKGHKPVPIWHPSHKGKPIDDCDDDEPDWHWAGKKHPVKPLVPHWKWSKTVIKVTKTVTITKGGTVTKTVTEKDEETPCPVPITKTKVPHPPKPTPDHPKPPPKPPVSDKPQPPVTKPPPKPTGNASSPPPVPTSRVVVTGAAPQNIQRTGGVLAAVAAVVAALF